MKVFKYRYFHFGIAYLKKMELELINFELELKFATKIWNPQINLQLNFFIQNFLFHDNRTLNINYSE